MNAPDLSALKYDDRGLVVSVVQDAAAGTVLMVAYMNREAIQRTIETGEAHFWSRSRSQLWRKGDTSGNVMHVESIQPDCDGDALLLSVHPTGPACHTGSRSCFSKPAALLDDLDVTLQQRRTAQPEGSYTAALFKEGRQGILRKVGEEAVEVLLAGQGSDKAAIAHEVADLWFHTLLLLADTGLSSRDVLEVLSRRRGGTTS
jgi:phosphoribosyl-ATP pyrophosphohydrolase/phosphoribosyl-AMP cyclohydrolase